MLSGILEISARQQVLVLAAVMILAWALDLFGRRRRWTRSSVLDFVRARAWRGPLVTFLLVLVLRGALQPALGTPVPFVHDEFSYLLAGDTFAHFRLTNPSPAEAEHFETFHQIVTPTYQSKFWIGQGLILAAGQVFFHNPWIGILLTTALMAAAVCWALQAFVPLTWAFLGGVLCALRLGIVSYWMNSYWGGSLAALGGALCLGAVARLLLGNYDGRTSRILGLTAGVGLTCIGFTRPFEGIFFSIPLAIWWVTKLLRREGIGHRRSLLQALATASISVALALAFLAYYNYRTTGNAAVTPYSIYQAKYALAPLFLWGHPQAAHQFTHQVMRTFYIHWEYGFYNLTRSSWGLRYSEESRCILLFLFYVGPVLSIALLAGVVTAIRDRKRAALLVCLVTMLGAYCVTTFYQPHYFAPAAVAVCGLLVLGLQEMWSSRWPLLKALAGALCIVALVFALGDSYGMPYIDLPELSPHELVDKWVGSAPGRHLVVVYYYGRHNEHFELVFNGANLAGEKVLWARGMGLQKDRELCAAYSDRTPWMLATDDFDLTVRPVPLCPHPSTSQAASVR